MSESSALDIKGNYILESLRKKMIVKSDARHIPITNDTVQCVVTSPPYYGLRKYAGAQELVWGGNAACQHEWETKTVARISGGGDRPPIIDQPAMTGTCQFCGAWRGAFGLEPTIEMYVEHSVQILREIRRVLRTDGVCFWNIGDSYSAGGRVGHGTRIGYKQGTNRASAGGQDNERRTDPGLKPKDLCLIPARIAIAAQKDGWWVRSDIIWNKPNPMPESVQDRPTDAYEHILMLTKSARYYWDAEAVSEPVVESSIARLSQDVEQQTGSTRVPGKTNGNMKAVAKGGASAFRGQGHFRDGENGPANRAGRNMKEVGASLTRNLRNVWTFTTQPYSGAHFATFPPELVIRCLQAATKQGDIVLDPFGGTGTVGEVAFNMQRRFVLCDLAYHDLQCERIPPMADMLS